MSEAGPSGQTKDGNAAPVYPVLGYGHGVEAPHLDPLLLQVLSGIEKDLTIIKSKLESLVLLQGQLAVMERQLDSITILSARSFHAGVKPEAMEVATKQAEEQAKAFSEAVEKEIEAQIEARGGDGPPTEEEIKKASEESYL